MSRRLYLAAALTVGLAAVSAVWAQSADGQKDKEKSKTPGQTDKNTLTGGAPSQFFTVPLTMGDGAYLGVFLEEVTADRLKELGLSEERGAIVMKVVPNSPAEKSGVKENDVIVSYNGHRVESVRELQRLLGETPPDRSVTMEVIRGGSHQTLSATLSKKSNSTYFDWAGPEVDVQGAESLRRSEEAMKEGWRRSQEQFNRSQESLRKMPRDFGSYAFVSPGEFGLLRGDVLGISAESLSTQLAEYFGAKDGAGVLVTEVDANRPAGKAGLKAGDVIIAVDHEKVNGPRALINSLANKKDGHVTLTILRDHAQQEITVKIERSAPPVVPGRVRV